MNIRLVLRQPFGHAWWARDGRSTKIISLHVQESQHQCDRQRLAFLANTHTQALSVFVCSIAILEAFPGLFIAPPSSCLQAAPVQTCECPVGSSSGTCTHGQHGQHRMYPSAIGHAIQMCTNSVIAPARKSQQGRRGMNLSCLGLWTHSYVRMLLQVSSPSCPFEDREDDGHCQWERWIVFWWQQHGGIIKRPKL